MKQQDSEQASDHDMPEDDKERMPEKYETVSLDDFVKYNIMKENIDLCESGIGNVLITKELNEKNVLTPSEYNCKILKITSSSSKVAKQ